MKAYQLLKNPKKWMQGQFAKNKKGNIVNLQDKQAYSFCIVGAVYRCYKGEEGYAKRSLLLNALSHLGNPSVVAWNDAPERTHAQVLTVLKELNI